MKTMPLTKNKVAIIDDDDFPLVSKYKWYYTQCGKVGYARTNFVANGKQFNIYMHNLILPHPKGMHTDHISHDALDNRRCNLRICTHAQNLHNCGKRKTNKSGYLGVFRKDSAWAFKAVTNGVAYTKQGIKTPELAARAYDAHIRSVRGEFAHTNFPD